MKKLLLSGVILIFHISLSFTSAAARDVYVSTNGSSSGTGSIESPLDKVSRALVLGNPGDAIIVRGGTYSEGEIWYTGSGGDEEAYLTITAYPGEEPILAGSRLIIESKYIRIQNLHFLGEQLIVRRWEGHGYQMSHHIEILNNHFSLDKVAIFINCNNGLIQHNVFESAQYAIYLMHGDGNVIRGNQLYNTSSYSIHIYDENKYQYAGENDPRITNLLVENNIIIGSKTRAGIVVSAGESSALGIHIDGVTIRNNVINDNKAAGIAVLYYGSVRNLEIYNNTIYNNSNCGIRVNSLEDADNITIINNILSNNQSNHISISGVRNKTVKNNLYWFPETVGSGVTDTNAVFGDPFFENVSQNNFHLLEGSQAIDAGKDIGINNDLEGNLRPQGSGYDLGAYEYIQTSVSVPAILYLLQ